MQRQAVSGVNKLDQSRDHSHPLSIDRSRVSLMSIEIALHRGAESDSLLNDHGFQKQWQALYERCPWGTVFQGPGYLGTWYDVYGPIYEPALVVSFGNCEELVGFLALAVDRGSGSLVIAGKPHAEYYGWLALPETSNAFIQTALDFLRVEFPKDRLDFRFLPPNTPLGWLHISSKWNRWCELTSNPRPLMAVRDGSKILESFRKKSNKSRLNRLERLGSLEFIRVKTF